MIVLNLSNFADEYMNRIHVRAAVEWGHAGDGPPCHFCYLICPSKKPIGSAAIGDAVNDGNAANEDATADCRCWFSKLVWVVHQSSLG